MIFANSKASFPLRCPSGKQETEGFHWIRKESEVAKFVTHLDFSYNDGFVVTFCVPREWSSEQLVEVIDRVCVQYSDKFF